MNCNIYIVCAGKIHNGRILMHSFDDVLTIGREEKLQIDIYCHSVIPSQLVFVIGKLKINAVDLMT